MGIHCTVLAGGEVAKEGDMDRAALLGDRSVECGIGERSKEEGKAVQEGNERTERVLCGWKGSRWQRRQRKFGLLSEAPYKRRDDAAACGKAAMAGRTNEET